MTPESQNERWSSDRKILRYDKTELDSWFGHFQELQNSKQYAHARKAVIRLNKTAAQPENGPPDIRLPRRGNTRQHFPRKKFEDTHPTRRLGKTEKPNTSFWEQRKSQTLRFGKRGLRTLPYSTIAAPHVQTRHPDRRSARTAYNLGQKDAGAIRNDADDSVGLTCCKR